MIKKKLEKRLATLRTRYDEIATVDLPNEKDEEVRAALGETLKALKNDIEEIESIIADLDKSADDDETDNGARSFNPLKTMELRTLGSMSFDTGNTKRKEGEKMNDTEIRSFQKFICNGGRNMTESEQRALNISGSAAVLPVEIFGELITEGKYSDLLHRAKVFNEPNAGKLNIPIASGNAATWHEELAPGAEASPTLSAISLGGYELLRNMSMSAATESMTATGFKEAIMQLLSAEVVETLENAFINGTGNNMPKGLASLSWTAENTIEADTTRGITYKDIAAGLGKLPQKYSRNAILIMNANTAFTTIAAADDSNGQPIFNLGEASRSMLGHEVVISEHVADNTIYIADPRELYIRFAMPVRVETDRSSGFTSATTNIRALCVVDSAWNEAACVKVVKASA